MPASLPNRSSRTTIRDPKESSGRLPHDRQRFRKLRLNTQNLFCTAGITLAGLLLPAFLCSPVFGREDNARLVFQKTAGIKDTQAYIVKKGDCIDGILQDRLINKPASYKLIRQLNPRIRDLNRIYPGQRIFLPGDGKIGPPESPGAIGKESEILKATYKIQAGDSISRIILTELHVNPAEGLKTYRLIRQMNPEIADLNHLLPGQVINLPPNLVHPTQDAAALPLTADRPVAKTDAETVMKIPPTAEGLLALIRPVITRMNGSLTAQGSYFIPLKEAGQLTIDCSLIPVVELDDGATSGFRKPAIGEPEGPDPSILDELRFSYCRRASRWPHIAAANYQPFPELHDG
jgi:LysM repeat protein